MDQPLALSPLTTIIATASRQGVAAASLPAAPSPAPAAGSRKLLQGGAAPAPAPSGGASGASTAGKLDPGFAITEAGGSSSSLVSTGASFYCGWLAGWLGLQQRRRRSDWMAGAWHVPGRHGGWRLQA